MMRIARDQARKRLALLWFPWAGILFLVLLLQCMRDRYADKWADAWGWILPTVMPTLALIVGVFVAQAMGKPVKEKTVEVFFFWFTFALSAAYLLAVSLTILIPF